MDAVIQVDRLRVRRGDPVVLHDVTFSVEPGDFLAIVGPNGAGKTTLLHTLLGLLTPEAGGVWIAGRSIRTYTRRRLARLLSYVPQNDGRAISFTVEEFILLGRYAHRGRFAAPDREDRRVLREAMEVTGTRTFADRPVSSLSGGERQKVLIAAALAQEADVLLLDEPTVFLDPRHQVEATDLLCRLHQQRALTILMVTHDLNVAAQCRRVLAVRDGSVAYYGLADGFLTADILGELYGVPFDILRRPDGRVWAAVGATR